MTKAVIFDLDGTLLNTLDDLADSCNETLRQMNFPLRSIDEVRQFVGNGIAKLMELAIPNGKKNPEYEKSVLLMKENYAKNWQNKTRPYDGILDLISTLNEMKIKTGIVSNKPDAQVKELAEYYFSSSIKRETAVGDFEDRNRKPSPDSVLEVMRILEVNRDETIYVGDSDVDIKTAKNAGIPCISVTWGFRDRNFLLDSGAQKLVDKPEEILKYL
ncbi:MULTISPECIES: HAD family hydrolase [unclassified Treponema]|uniref:HAD family hydrolase n=1 Tax=unclassified Treponema TaxID=2638727 RepID=UPI000E9E3A3A|nr:MULTISPECIES: HAD family hydrolase [unclassified Treponema]HBP10123.1 HAD family hydrolase [Treponema sp.]